MIYCPWSCYLLQKQTACFQCLDNEEQEAVWNAYEVWAALDASHIPSPEKLASELVLQLLHKFLHIFQKHESECIPTHKSWNHVINLKNTFKAKKDRLIPLLPQEQEEVSTFINEQLHKRYIIHPNLPKCHLCFSCPKRMGRSEWYRTTIT